MEWDFHEGKQWLQILQGTLPVFTSYHSATARADGKDDEHGSCTHKVHIEDFIGALRKCVLSAPGIQEATAHDKEDAITDAKYQK